MASPHHESALISILAYLVGYTTQTQKRILWVMASGAQLRMILGPRGGGELHLRDNAMPVRLRRFNVAALQKSKYIEPTCRVNWMQDTFIDYKLTRIGQMVAQSYSTGQPLSNQEAAHAANLDSNPRSNRKGQTSVSARSVKPKQGNVVHRVDSKERNVRFDIVKINSATALDIATLWGIGPRIAQRIIDHRNQFGYFHGVNDLAKVPGVSLQIAEQLSPSIDFSEPDQPTLIKNRNWPHAVFDFFVTIFILQTGEIVFSRLHLVLSNLHNSRLLPNDVLVFILVSMLVGVICILPYQFARIGISLTRSKSRAWRLSQIGRIFQIAACVIPLFVFIVQVVAVWMYYPRGTLYAPYIAATSLFLFVAIVILLPPIIIPLRPSIGQSHRLARLMYYVGISLVLSYALSVLATGNVASLATILFSGLIGLFVIIHAVLSMRTGNELNILNLGFMSRPLQNAIPKGYLLTWIDKELPNAADQQTLKQALDKRYRPSIQRRMPNYLLFIVGCWLLLTALQGVIQWIEATWLSHVFGNNPFGK